MGLIVHGGCIEPEGWELQDERWTTECPRCGHAARAWNAEKAEGSLNIYRGMACYACDYRDGDDPDSEP
jgi:hypothetical protein